jgi:hypothetical protein
MPNPLKKPWSYTIGECLWNGVLVLIVLGITLAIDYYR